MSKSNSINKNIFLISITGGSGSGKSTVANELNKLIIKKKITSQIICLDDFYISDHNKKMPKINNKINYDHPNAFDWKLLNTKLTNLLKNKKTNLPIYDLKNNLRLKKTKTVLPTTFIIVEGILVMHSEVIKKYSNLNIFIDTPSDICLARRIMRDIADRKRKIEKIIESWQEIVRPMYFAFIEPYKRTVDVILPWEKIDAKLPNIFNWWVDNISK